MLSELTPQILTQAIASLTPEQLKALGIRRQATDEEVAAYDQAHAAPGAPADFAGPVFSNPDGVKVSEDTDPGGEPTRLSAGATLQRGNFTGRTPGDTSNPAAAQILPGAMQTIAGKYDASKPEDKPKFDPSQEYTKEGSAPAFNPDGDYQAAPADTPPADNRGWLDREIPLTDHWKATESGLQSLVRSGRDVVAGMADLVKAPETDLEKKIATVNAGALPVYRMLTGLGHTAKDALQAIDAIHDINASPDPVGEYAKMAQGMASDGAAQALAALASDGLVRGIPKAVEAPKAVATAPVRLGARAAETAINQKLLPVKKLVKLMTPADEAESLTVKVPGRDYGLKAKAKPVYPGAPLPEDPGIFPGADLPEKPAPEVLQARALQKPEIDPRTKPLGKIPVRTAPEAAASEVEDLEGHTSPQTEHAAESEPEPEPAPADGEPEPESHAEILNKPGTPAELEKRLNQALGGKPLQKGVPLRNQVPGRAAAPRAEALPEGFTPIDSSVLKGYKYDAATREFESITNDGRHYIHGEVSPDQAQAFADAQSKGTAWSKEIRANNPLIAKVLNGKRVPVQTAGMEVPETGERIPKAEAGMKTPLEEKARNLADFIRMKPDEALASPTPKKATVPKKPAASADLTEQLQQSLNTIKVGKGGVFTSATPADLLERWGVDPESFVEGRSQTRGMKPEESEAAIAKLAKAYKKGQAIEPVMETRDAANNIIEVDGRSRALAAHRAGIERIPIIVRRIQ